MKVLFCGDIVGRSGRDVVIREVPRLRRELLRLGRQRQLASRRLAGRVIEANALLAQMGHPIIEFDPISGLVTLHRERLVVRHPAEPANLQWRTRHVVAPRAS